MHTHANKDKEAELLRQNRLLHALADSRLVMMNIPDEAPYLREVSRIVTEDCGFAMVWIGFAQDDDAKTVRPVAYAGFAEGYLETLQITWADTERGRGPVGTAIRTGRPCGCKDMQNDPSFSPWRKDALQRGYASLYSVPLLGDGKAFGAITFYAREVEDFGEKEVMLFAMLAKDVAHGIALIRLRKKMSVEEQLKRDKDAAESANAAKSRFLAMMSHDLRTPLNSIIGFSEFLLIDPSAETLQSKQKENILQIAKSGRLLLKIVDDLLNLSAIETGKVSLNKEKIDLKLMLTDLMKIYDFLAGEKSLRWHCDIQVSKGVFADHHRLWEVLNNLVGNAIKYSKPAGTVTIGARENTDEVLLFVKDEGVGIDQEDIDRIFVPFEECKYPGIYDTKKSVGLGLAICQKLIALHGGKLTVESAINRGSCFTFTLPHAVADTHAQDNTQK